MDQFLVIIRGGPASGKTTISKKLRDPSKKIVWLKVDNFKDFFSDDSKPEEQKFVDNCALSCLENLFDQGFSVVMEKIFYDPFILPLAEQVAQKNGVICKVFQIKCSLNTLLQRDQTRPGIKEGCRKQLGADKIKALYNQLEKTFYPTAISLDTENQSIDTCVEIIKKEIGLNN